MNDTQLEQMAREDFGLRPTAEVRALSAGNINRSWMVDTDEGPFILQQLNTAVFEHPEAMMANTVAIIERAKGANLPVVEFVPTTTGSWLAELEGALWRCSRYLDGTAHDAILTSEDAQSTARAFGRFAEAIDGLELHEHIVGYHHFDGRVERLLQVIDQDELARAGPAAADIYELLREVDRLRLSGAYEAWREMPVRNAHNDAKAPNCVVSSAGARTIIDLDTTMPSILLADVGELVRSATRAIQDPSPELLMGQIEAVNRGFLAGYRHELSDAEQSAMLLAGPLLATENAVRFLTDHLSGDKYYGAEEPGQNLVRAAAQLRLARSLMEAVEFATSG